MPHALVICLAYVVIGVTAGLFLLIAILPLLTKIGKDDSDGN